MALTNIQRDICRVLAARISRDLDLFHDTAEALQATWEADVRSLRQAGLMVKVIRERPAYVEALVKRETESVILEWTHDSAFRFFSTRGTSRFSV